MFRATYLNGLGQEEMTCGDGSTFDPVGQVCCPVGSLFSTATRKCECTDSRKRMNETGDACICAPPGFLGGQGASCECPPGSVWQEVVPGVAEVCMPVAGIAAPAPTPVLFDPGDPSLAALGNVAFVRSLYNELLGYDPDPSGLAWWVTILMQGTSREDVRAAFMDGAEYRGSMLPATPQVAPEPGILDPTLGPYVPSGPNPDAPRPIIELPAPPPPPVLSRRSIGKIAILALAAGFIFAKLASAARASA